MNLHVENRGFKTFKYEPQRRKDRKKKGIKIWEKIFVAAKSEVNTKKGKKPRWMLTRLRVIRNEGNFRCHGSLRKDERKGKAEETKKERREQRKRRMGEEER